jgi:hypothetical protein
MAGFFRPKSFSKWLGFWLRVDTEIVVGQQAARAVAQRRARAHSGRTCGDLRRSDPTAVQAYRFEAIRWRRAMSLWFSSQRSFLTKLRAKGCDVEHLKSDRMGMVQKAHGTYGIIEEKGERWCEIRYGLRA